MDGLAVYQLLKNSPARACVSPVGRFLLLIGVILALTGCAQLAATKQAGKVISAQIADDKVKAAIWSLCNAQSVGAIRRQFNTIAELNTYIQWCNEIDK